jgi:hypothetical protein
MVILNQKWKESHVKNTETLDENHLKNNKVYI